MKVLALINQKGGSGKTTIALHMATAAWQAGLNTLLIDLDPQTSAAEWHDSRAEEFPAVLSIQPTRLQKALQTAAESTPTLSCSIRPRTPKARRSMRQGPPSSC